MEGGGGWGIQRRRGNGTVSIVKKGEREVERGNRSGGEGKKHVLLSPNKGREKGAFTVGKRVQKGGEASFKKKKKRDCREPYRGEKKKGGTLSKKFQTQQSIAKTRGKKKKPTPPEDQASQSKERGKRLRMSEGKRRHPKRELPRKKKTSQSQKTS